MFWQRFGIALIWGGMTAFFFIKTFKKHKKIDTCAYAYVKKVNDIGYLDRRKVYAITYQVDAKEPFEVIISPCKKALEIGKKRLVYFEKGNMKNNHYFSRFKKINIDKRFFPSITCFVFFLATFISAIISLFS